MTSQTDDTNTLNFTKLSATQEDASNSMHHVP